MIDSRRVLAFDIGRSFTRHAVVTDGNRDIPSSFSTPADDSEALFDAIANVVRQYEGGIDGISLSLPGFVDIKRQRLVAGGSVNALYRQNVGDELRKRLGDDTPIWMENDANCIAIAEKNSGNARKLNDFVVFSVTDTGVAGEIGMMITNYQTEGTRSLHEFSSTNSLGERYAEEFGGPAEVVVPSSLLRRMGEPGVGELVEEWAKYIAVGIFNIVVSLDPECVLLGGSVCQEAAFLPLIRQSLESIPSWKDFNTPVKRCRNASYAGLIGAYYAFVTEVR